MHRGQPAQDALHVTFRDFLRLLRQIYTWLIAPALLVVIYGELAHSDVVNILESNIWDKALHFTAYFGLCFMTTIAARNYRGASWFALGLVVLGGVLEIIQGYTGRDCDIYDEIANSIGVVCGFCAAWSAVAILKVLKLVADAPPD